MAVPVAVPVAVPMAVPVAPAGMGLAAVATAGMGLAAVAAAGMGLAAVATAGTGAAQAGPGVAEVRVGVCLNNRPPSSPVLFQSPSAAPVGWPRLVYDHLPFLVSRSLPLICAGTGFAPRGGEGRGAPGKAWCS